VKTKKGAEGKDEGEGEGETETFFSIFCIPKFYFFGLSSFEIFAFEIFTFENFAFHIWSAIPLI